MIDKYVEQILRTYNHVDTFILTDEKGYINYYLTYRPDVNTNDPKQRIGQHVLEAWPKDIDEKTSTIMRVIRTGEAVLNEYQEFHYGDLLMPSSNTTLPIVENDRLVGTATMVKYLRKPFARNEIVLEATPRLSQAVYNLDDIKGVSLSIENLKEKIKMVAGTGSSVLIYGETGTGKELVAQSIHNLSPRANKRFVSQNCAAIPENLLESILFGSVKGSYTGAENHPGVFEVAKGGTLFLDEINSMPLSMQAKILKAIEEKQVTRIGGTEPIMTDVRIISAINEHPMDILSKGIMRRDLFYRLSVVELDIEPLRHRKEDLDYLVKHFISEFNSKMNRAVMGLSDEVYEIFRNYDWPGNVRELRNIMEGAFNMSTSRYIEKEFLPNYLFDNKRSDAIDIRPAADAFLTQDDFNLKSAMEKYENAVIEAAVNSSSSLSEAARKLGISRQNLNYKLQKSKSK